MTCTTSWFHWTILLCKWAIRLRASECKISTIAQCVWELWVCSFPVLPALFPLVWDVFQWSRSISREMVNFKDTVLSAIRDWFCTTVLKNPMLEKKYSCVFIVPNTPENGTFVRGWGWRGNVFLGSYLGFHSSTEMVPHSWLAVCCLLKRMFSECFSNGTLIFQVTLLTCMGYEMLHLPHRLIYWLSIRKDAVLVRTKEQIHDLRALLKHRRFHSNYHCFP